MAQTSQRAFALIMALLFAVTTVGFSGYVIWEMYNEGKNNKATPTAQQSAQNTESEDPLTGEKLQNFEPLGEEKVTELQVIDQEVGDGAEAKADSSVKVHYTGALASDGSIFDSSLNRGEPLDADLAGGLIEGFSKGVVGMKVGGKRRILIPSAQGYGDQGSATIPANSDLVFDIELTEVK